MTFKEYLNEGNMKIKGKKVQGGYPDFEEALDKMKIDWTYDTGSDTFILKNVKPNQKEEIKQYIGENNEI